MLQRPEGSIDRRVVLLVGLWALAAAIPVHAANTGSLAGEVLDADGGALAGAAVQVSSEYLIGGPQRAVTGPDGRFAFRLLPVGTYLVEASLTGWLSASGEVRVMSNHVGAATLYLAREHFTGMVEVSADVPVIDTSQVNAGVVWDDDFLQKAALGIDPSTLAYCTFPDGGDINSTINHSPGGSFESTSLWQLDLLLSKTFHLRTLDLQAILTVYNLFGQESVFSVTNRAFVQDTDADSNGLNYQDDDQTAPYYDEYYGADNSPVLVPIGETLRYLDPRRYEIGFRIEF